MEEKSYKSWTMSDEFWDKIKDVIPDTAGKRDPNKTYRHKPGQGRKPLPPRKVLEGVLYVLRTPLLNINGSLAFLALLVRGKFKNARPHYDTFTCAGVGTLLLSLTKTGIRGKFLLKKAQNYRAEKSLW